MLLIRNHSTAALLLGLPGILLYECVWAGFAVLRGFLGAYFRGKRAFFGQLPQLLRERREIQRRRVVSDRRLLRAHALTHAPMVKSSRLLRWVDRSLGGLLSAWWWCVRPLVR